MAAFSSIDPTFGNLGSLLTDGNTDVTTISDFPSAAIPPMYLDPVLTGRKTPLLAAMNGGLGAGGNKELMSNSKQMVGDIKYRWAEMDDPPVRWVVASVTGGSDYLTVDNAYGLVPGMQLKNQRTDAIITITSMDTTSTAPSDGERFGDTVEPTDTTYVFYSGTDPVVGDELGVVGQGFDERSTEPFSFDIQPRMRHNTMTDLQYAYAYTMHAAQLRTEGFSIPEREKIHYKNFMTQVESALLLGEASSSTPGGTSAVSGVDMPNYNGTLLGTNIKIRRGEGLYAQIKNYGHTESFGGSFDFDALDEIIYELTRKTGQDQLVALCGADCLRAISRYQEARVSPDSYAREYGLGLEEIFKANVKTINTRSNVSINMVEHPILSQYNAHRGTMMVFPLENLKTVQLQGYDWNGKGFQEVGPAASNTKTKLVRSVVSVALQNAHGASALISDVR